MQDKLAAGRGKSKAFAAKVAQTAILLLNGTLADAAAAAAGFKGSAARGSKGGASSPSNRLADGLRRRGLRIVSKRGAFAQDLDEHEQAARRGGAAVDLKTLYVPSVVKTSAPVVVPAGVPLPRGHVLPSHVSATSARVVGLHPLSKASSGLPSGSAASESVELSSLPALPAQLRRVVAAGNRRKLQGVLRPKSARGVSSVGDGGAAARVAAFVNADELGAAMVARVAAGAAGAAAARQAAARQAAAAGHSDSVELRRVWVSGFGPSYEGASLAGWFNYRSKWADVRGKLVYVGTFQSGFVCRG
jgi:hypothetical protein